MNAPETKTSFEDFAEFPSPYLKAMIIRLRIEMFSVAASMQGELAREFWQIVDDLNAHRARLKL